MFTGIITDVGTVETVRDHGETLRRLRIRTAYDPETIALGASIACGGPCLTVVAIHPHEAGGCSFEVDAAAETLALTTVGRWVPGTRINLERSLKIGDELGGHIVTGHVDGLAKLIRRDELSSEAGGWGATARFHCRAPGAIARFIAQKGSVALDGTSLTVNTVEDDVFSVLVIPHTLAVTTWGALREGDDLNIEVDLMARYAARLVEARRT
jgi:riboflavin synthase